MEKDIEKAGQSSKNKRIAYQVLSGGLLIAALFFAASRKKIMTSAESYAYMGTRVNIVSIGPGRKASENALDIAYKQLEMLETIFSYHDPNSELNMLNSAGDAGPFKVSDHLFEVIEKGVEYGRFSGGSFDITIGPLVDLWKNAAKTKTLPSEEEKTAAKSLVDYRNLVLDANERTVFFKVEGMKIDLGGIAKGYSIDVIVEAMKEAGATGGMVDIGGDIRCFGAGPADSDGWRIGLQDPAAADKADSEQVMLTFNMNYTAIATSGNYRRFVEIDGKRYSHIINPATRISAGGLSSVTVIAPGAADADALATAISIMGAEKGMALIERLDPVEALLIMEKQESELIKSSGVDSYIVENVD